MTEEDYASPAERMEQFRKHMQIEESGLSLFLEALPFSPDPFQVEALEAVALGQSVLVSAPTGSGKTVVGEGAAFLALQEGKRVFYTTPIKALSNQKFHDFQKEFGEDRVGLLTGDVSINGDAPLVVMTTEVLRNMIYVGKDLSNLGTVVVDEVHYLSDKYRGPVWEEVIIQLPLATKVVALSATVSNYEQFANWISSVRGSCTVVISDVRPVPLYQRMMAGYRLYDLFATPRKAAKNPGVWHRLNPELEEAMTGDGRHRPRAPRPAPRPVIVERLDSKHLLPAIFFIFSRAGCDDAAKQVAEAHLGLTNAEERRKIDEATSRALALVPAADHAALGLDSWAEMLRSGVAAHHAGLLPAMKETVEELFSKGLLKVVFATETLALGINMPARTVVLESLEKWDGSEHVPIGPREYTQLTGRAGRRGIDKEGNAVVVASRGITPEEVAELASKRSYPLDSAFFPSYNMAVNLLARSDMAEARSVLESSFAQYQADEAVVALAQKLRKTQEELAEVEGELQCSRGDAKGYFLLREEIASLQKRAGKLRREEEKNAKLRLLSELRAGELVRFRRGRRWKRAVVVAPADKGYSVPLVGVVDENGKTGKLGPREAGKELEVLGRMHVPHGGTRRTRDRQFIARDVRDFRPTYQGGKKVSADPRVTKLLDRVDRLQAELEAHPVHSCPDRESHAVLGHRYARLLRRQEQLSRQIESRTARIVGEFDQVCHVLRILGFLEGDRVSKRGQSLRRIYGERDLVVAEAINQGIWEELTPVELAAIVSAVVYEPRADASGHAYIPTPRLQQAWDATSQIAADIRKAEKKAGLERTGELSPELIEMTYRWARGATLAQVLEHSELSGGDFVRWMRQVLDMLQQIRRVPGTNLRDSARIAYQDLLRGVVAWSDDL